MTNNVNDVSFPTCPKHESAQQAPRWHRSARAGQHHQQSGTVRPQRRSPGGEVCPDTALNCSLTSVRSINQSTHFACACSAHEVVQTLEPFCDRVWIYKAGSKIPPTGHHQIHRMRLMRAHLVRLPKVSRQPIQGAIVRNVSELPATVQSSHRRKRRTFEARQTIGRRMLPEADARTSMLHNLTRQADIIARDPKIMGLMVEARHLTQRPTRDAQGTRRSRIGTSPRSRT